MNTKKIITIVSTHSFVFFLGFVLSTIFLDEIIEYRLAMQNTMTLHSYYFMHSEFQKIQGTPESYRDSLYLYLKAQKSSKSDKDPFFSESAYKTDRMFTYLRLSKLENSLRNSIESNTNRDEAIKICKSMKWKDCSYKKLSWLLEQLEKNTTFKSHEE